MKAEYDFSHAKRATDISHLNKLRSERNKKRITIYLDEDVVDGFKIKASEVGTGYQTEINRVLKQYLKSDGLPFEALDEMVRQIVRDELLHTKT